MISQQQLKLYVEGRNSTPEALAERGYSPEGLADTIREITFVVINRYYKWNMANVEEMVSLAACKAISLLSSPHVESNKNLVNLLFTGIRNEIGNQIKKDMRAREHAKGVVKEDEEDEEGGEDYKACARENPMANAETEIRYNQMRERIMYMVRGMETGEVQLDVVVGLKRVLVCAAIYRGVWNKNG